MRDDGISGHHLETAAAAIGDPAPTTSSPKTTINTASFKGRGNGCTVAGLSPNTLYHFRVCAVNKRTRSMLSAPLEVRAFVRAGVRACVFKLLVIHPYNGSAALEA